MLFCAMLAELLGGHCQVDEGGLLSFNLALLDGGKMIGTRSALFDPELPATDRGTLSEPPNLTMPRSGWILRLVSSWKAG